MLFFFILAFLKVTVASILFGTLPEHADETWVFKRHPICRRRGLLRAHTLHVQYVCALFFARANYANVEHFFFFSRIRYHAWLALSPHASRHAHGSTDEPTLFPRRFSRQQGCLSVFCVPWLTQRWENGGNERRCSKLAGSDSVGSFEVDGASFGAVLYSSSGW